LVLLQDLSVDDRDAFVLDIGICQFGIESFLVSLQLLVLLAVLKDL
jgi:hypothetical protein